MRYIKRPNYFLIIFTFLIGVFFSMIPLPSGLIWARPEWVFALLLFWVLTLPRQCGVILAWFIGLFMDLIMGTPLGQQAMVFVILVYILLKGHAIIIHLPPSQQACVIGLMVGMNAILQGIILNLTGHTAHIGLHWIAAFTTALIWPLLYGFLNRIQPRRISLI